MSEAYVKDLCKQLNALASLSGSNACVRTRTGKVEVDHSVGAMLWRKLINMEEESRTTTVQGIETLLDTVNDYVASTLHLTPIVRNVTIEPKHENGKIVSESTHVNGGPSSEDEEAVGVDKTRNRTSVERSQERFFAECDNQMIERLRELSVALKNCCKGTSALLSTRYRRDYETVPLLIDQINYAALIAKRIDNMTESSNF